MQINIHGFLNNSLCVVNHTDKTEQYKKKHDQKIFFPAMCKPVLLETSNCEGICFGK